MKLKMHFELIDTLWNVNNFSYVDNNNHEHRINRYIMECKYTSYYSYSSEPDSELIDTLWNVNTSSKCLAFDNRP